MAEFIFSMYIAYHDVKAWKFGRCGLAGNRGESPVGELRSEERIFYHISLIF